MLDTYVDRADRSTQVHVERLPHDTADAARLYGEMVEKAKKEVLTATLDQFGADNELKLVRVDQQLSMETWEHHIIVMFRLNGKDYDFKVKKTERYLSETRTAFLEAIASEVANEAMRVLVKSFR